MTEIGMITREKFVAATGREPQHDDLERTNCKQAGMIGHWCCGWNEYFDKPQFDIGPRYAGICLDYEP